MRTRLPCLLTLGGLLACAPARQPWTEAIAARPEVLLEVLPVEAVVRQDGAVIGAGALTVRLGEGPSSLEVSAAGFEPRQVVLDPRTQAGARVGVVLRPVGYGEARPLALEDGAGLAAASAWLLRAGKVVEATDYAERAVQASPATAAPRRALGLALARQGKRSRAAQELSQYLQLAPGAPDRAEIEAAVERFRGDISIPARGY